VAVESRVVQGRVAAGVSVVAASASSSQTENQKSFLIYFFTKQITKEF
jgi:hypothetical protein